MNKPRLIAVTDPEEADALTADKADLSVPFTVSPNGMLWVDAQELERWRSQRTSDGDQQ